MGEGKNNSVGLTFTAKRYHHLIGAAGLFVSAWLLLLCNPPYIFGASTPSAVLLPSISNTAAYASDETLHIQVGGGAVRYAALLDNMDVSSFLEVRGSEIQLHSPETLTGGAHQLILYEEHEGGSKEIGRWQFQVLGQIDVNFHAVGTVNLSARVAESGAMGDGDSWQADGSVYLDASVKAGEWLLEGYGDIFLQTNDLLPDVNGSEQRTIDLGQYLLTLSRGNINARVGHHQTGPQSLIMSGFNRRGASLNMATKNERITGSGFVYYTQPISGIRNFFGMDHSEERVTGVAATVQPFSFGNTEVSATWLTGKSSPSQGLQQVQFGEQAKGDAWSVALSSSPFTESLLVRAEYAQSDYLRDTNDPQSSSKEDAAWLATVMWTPLLPTATDSQSLSLQTGLEGRHVGPSFRSLANQGLPRDVDSVRLFATLGFGDWYVNTDFERQYNNTDDSPLLPTVRTDLASLAFSWQPAGGAKDVPWYGAPGLNVSYTHSAQEEEDSPAGLEHTLDLTSSQLNSSASFRYDVWDWQVGYSLGEQQDKTGTQADTRNQLFSLGVNGYFGKRLFGSTFIQFNETDDLSTHNSTGELLVNLNSTLLLYRDLVSATLNLSHSRLSDDDNTTDTETSTMDLGLNWVLMQAEIERPGATVWIKGQYQYSKDKLSSLEPLDNYQIFTGITISYEQ